MSNVLLGVDFDNTLVSYDGLFHRVAMERKLIPSDLEPTKGAVRDYLRQVGREDDWTEMQGYVYGPRLPEAMPFPRAVECLTDLVKRGVQVFIVSHKTRHPYRGPSYDLHGAAWQWLEQHGFFDRARIGLSKAAVFFELTKEDKIKRIARLGCTHFIDDLPEFLTEPAFPTGVDRILFDPNGTQKAFPANRRAGSWKEIADMLETESGFAVA